MIENVARAIWTEQRNHWGRYRDMVPDLCEWEELTQSKQRELLREAKAAIAAMTVQAEPVAWKNCAEDGDWWLTDDREPADSCARSVPLYAHPPVPQPSDAEIARLTEALRAAEERVKALREALEAAADYLGRQEFTEDGHSIYLDARAALKEQPHADAYRPEPSHE